MCGARAVGMRKVHLHTGVCMGQFNVQSIELFSTHFRK